MLQQNGGNMQVITLTNSDKCALVDDADYENIRNLPWREQKCSRTSYAIRSWRENSKTLSIYMHRQLLRAPKGLEVDHEDNNGLNNCRNNIRIVTPRFNRIRSRPHLRSRSGLKGVWFGKNHWIAEIHQSSQDGGKSRKYYLGMFVSRFHAALAFNMAACLLQGDYAYQNAIPIEEMPSIDGIRIIQENVKRAIIDGTFGRTGRRPDNMRVGVAAGTLI